MTAGAHPLSSLGAASANSIARGEQVPQELLRQGQVRHAVKTALTCCLAIGLALLFHFQSPQLAPVFAYLLMTTGMPSPRLNWLFTQLAVGISAVVSALLLLALGSAPLLYLGATLLWIFTCVLFSSWFPFAATFAAMVSAISIFVILKGTVGATLSFLFEYALNWVAAGFSVLLVGTLLWPSNTSKLFLQRLAGVYAQLEARCRRAAAQVLSGEPSPLDGSPHEWAPFRPLRQLVAPGSLRTEATSSPFARMILASRSLNLRLWFLDQALVPAITSAFGVQARRRLADLLEGCAGHLHLLLEGVTNRQSVAPVDPDLFRELRASRWNAGGATLAGRDVLLAHGVHEAVLRRVVEHLGSMTAAHNALISGLRDGPARELVALRPISTRPRLLDPASIRSGTKLVLMLLVLVVEEGVFRFPGGTQVAFFATFFATTGNLGRQNKTDLIGLTGLVAGFAFGLVAALLTSHLPELPLLLLLVFLGEFLANLAFQRWPRYGVVGMQAGLALPFAYLATHGPGWGSYHDVRIRFWGLVVAGFTAALVHAYVWPVMPMRRLRESIASALRETAVRLRQLSDPSRSGWEGPPPSLSETVLHARELLDDARYLPGADHADAAYPGILGGLQEIDANLEFVQFLLEPEGEHALHERFFEAVRDYGESASRSLEQVARQFDEPPSRPAVLEPVRWAPDASSRWEQASREVGPLDREADTRTAAIARCLDQIAQATERISSIAHEINRRNAR